MENFNLKKFLSEGRLLENDNLIDDLLSSNDGPAGTFSVIQRAIDMACSNEYDAKTISNSLYEALKEIGALTDVDIPSNEFR